MESLSCPKCSSTHIMVCRCMQLDKTCTECSTNWHYCKITKEIYIFEKIQNKHYHCEQCDGGLMGLMEIVEHKKPNKMEDSEMQDDEIGNDDEVIEFQNVTNKVDNNMLIHNGITPDLLNIITEHIKPNNTITQFFLNICLHTLSKSKKKYNGIISEDDIFSICDTLYYVVDNFDIEQTICDTFEHYESYNTIYTQIVLLLHTPLIISHINKVNVEWTRDNQIEKFEISNKYPNGMFTVKDVLDNIIKFAESHKQKDKVFMYRIDQYSIHRNGADFTIKLVSEQKKSSKIYLRHLFNEIL